MTNWKDIHQIFADENFGKQYKKNWEENGFDYNKTKSLINDVGLHPEEYDFAWWMINKNQKILESLNRGNADELREKYNDLEEEWGNIHQDFSDYPSNVIMPWIKKGFDYQQTKQWIKVGLNPHEYNLAVQLKESGFTPEKYAKFKSNNAQEWLDRVYPKEQRINIKSLNISKEWETPDEKKLFGSLKLEGFVNLENFDCINNNLTSLDCSNCSRLKHVNCGGNKLNTLNLTNCLSITHLYCFGNLLTNLNFLEYLPDEKLEELVIKNNNLSSTDLTPFSKFINLKELDLDNHREDRIRVGIYNHFHGSLEPSKNLNNLKLLSARNTDINSGLEYLPNSIMYFYCSVKERPESKIKLIEQELKKHGKPDSGSFADLLSTWKKTYQSINQETQIETSLGSSTKKSKSAKRKEKLNTAQEQINQLQTELEQEKAKNTNLQQENSFYKNFFNSHFQSKKTELIELKNKLTKEEQEWLDIYCEASQEIEKSSFIKKQLKRAKDNFKDKLSEEELKLILEKQTEITELENQLNVLQVQEARIEVLPNK